MKKRLNEKQEKGILFIKEWCFTIVNFIYSKSNNTDSFITEMHKEIFSEETKQKYLKETSAAIYIKGVREVYNDTNEWAKGLLQNDLEELNRILLKKFGKDLSIHFQKIYKITKRGKIINDDEFRLINEKVDELCQTEPESQEIGKLNKLLLVYEEKK